MLTPAMRAVLAVVLAASFVVVAADVRYGSASLPADRPRATLARVLGDGAPHPTGSPALAAVRGRIAEVFREIGVPADERSFVACGRYGACARVHQLVARVPGRDSTGSVLLVAHSDSVGASGGASDDGAGVAALLEVARAMAKARPRNDVLFAVLEGEELGLVGAEAFVERDPRGAQANVVINLEARGTHGPAQLFQTSRAGGELVALATHAMPRPVGSSLFATVYERMPNDTDLTVFLARGFAGLNFAFTSGVEAYHTSHDDLAHQSPASLAHLTESALGAVRAFSETDLRSVRPRDSVWFDVLGLFVVGWPASWSLPLATLGFIGVFASALRRRLRPFALARAIGWWLANVVLCVLGGLAVNALSPARAAWTAQPGWLLAASFGLPLCTSGALAAVLRVDAEAAASGVALVHGLLAIVLAHLLPGASYLLVVPSLVAALSFVALPKRPVLAIALPALAGLIASILVLRTLYPGLGVPIVPAIPLVSALFVLPFAALWWIVEPRVRRVAASVLALALVATIAIAATRPPFSPEAPRRTNVLHVEEAGAPRAAVAIDPTWVGQPWGEPPREMIAVLGADAREGLPSPWHPKQTWLASTPSLGLAAPTVEVVEGSRAAGRLRVRVRSERRATTLLLLAPPGSGLVGVDVEGAIGAARLFTQGLAPGWSGIRLDGIDDPLLTCRFAGGAGELLVLDATDSLPDRAGAVAAARPRDALPTQDGDRTIVFRRFTP